MMLKKSLVLGAMISMAAAACGGAVDAADEAVVADESVEQEARATPVYLALGDSVAFGHNPFADRSKIANFNGYPTLIQKAVGSRLEVINPSCVGESSGSFIDRSAPDNGCANWRSSGSAMHVAYASASQSQLAFALDILRRKGSAVKAVTLGIGANDILMLSNECAVDPAKYNECVFGRIQGVIGAAAGNAAKIIGAIRQVYRGPLAFVTYHTANYDPASLDRLAIESLNNGLKQAVAAVKGDDENLFIADAFAELEQASAANNGDACAAGLVIPRPDGAGCDFHPSLNGQREYVEALAKVAMPRR